MCEGVRSISSCMRSANSATAAPGTVVVVAATRSRGLVVDRRRQELAGKEVVPVQLVVDIRVADLLRLTGVRQQDRTGKDGLQLGHDLGSPEADWVVGLHVLVVALRQRQVILRQDRAVVPQEGARSG